MRLPRALGGWGVAITGLAGDARASQPLNYLVSHGLQNDVTLPLTKALIAVSLTVVLIIGLLIVAAILRRPGLQPVAGARLEVGPEGGGLSWIWIGVGLSSLVLLASIAWTVAVLGQTVHPPSKPKTRIEVTAHQWWWEVRYVDENPALDFATADEIHIPAGEPVAFKLIGGDVIHSFWVPLLGGKTDLIPGLTNESWLQADTPGTYRGQCAEYCGAQHAHMAFLVVAQSPQDFRRWRDSQLQSPAAPQGEAAQGAQLFTMHCGSCHSVRGTDAGGVLGPDLSHLMQRQSLAAATLPSDPAHLSQWVSDPQAIKPGAYMQKPELTAAELAAIRAYLGTLR